MEYRHVGALAGVVSVLGLVAQNGPSILLERWIDGGFGGVIPMVGTVGETVHLYSLLGNIVGPVVTLALAVGLGYYAGRELDVRHEYRRFGRVVAAGSAFGVAAIWAAQLVAVQFGSVTATSVLLGLVTLASLIASVSLVVAVGVFAGVALSHFRSSDPTPRWPTDDGPPASASVGSSSGSQKAPAEDPDADSSTR